jgi:lipoprotein signal peptidase
MPNWKPSGGAVIAASLVALDQITKATLTTAAWAEHARGIAWQREAVVAIVAVAAAGFVYRPVRLACTLLAAGLIGNLVSAVHGDVANPLMTQIGQTQIAFNVADVTLLAGAAATLLAMPRVGRDVYAWRLHRGFTTRSRWL